MWITIPQLVLHLLHTILHVFLTGVVFFKTNSWFAWRFFARGLEAEAPDEGVQDPPGCPTNDSTFRSCSWGRFTEKPCVLSVFLFLLPHSLSISLSHSFWKAFLKRYKFKVPQIQPTQGTLPKWCRIWLPSCDSIQRILRRDMGRGVHNGLKTCMKSVKTSFWVYWNYDTWCSPHSPSTSHWIHVPLLYCAGGASCFSRGRGAGWFREARGWWWDWEVFCRYIAYKDSKAYRALFLQTRIKKVLVLDLCIFPCVEPIFWACFPPSILGFSELEPWPWGRLMSHQIYQLSHL